MSSRFVTKSAAATAVLILGGLAATGVAAAPLGAIPAAALASFPAASPGYQHVEFRGCPGGGLPGDYGAYRCYKGYGGGGFYYGPGPYSFGAAGEPYYYGVFSRPDYPPQADSGCDRLHAKAVDSGSRYWWRRYRACTG